VVTDAGIATVPRILRVVQSGPTTPGFAGFHLNGDTVPAVEAINAAPEFMVGKQLIDAQTRVSRDRVADHDHSIRQVAASLRKRGRERGW